MEQKYRLEIIGITYNQIESGVYALILQQVGTNRRIPIIIGFPEAQAIECKLQDIKTPRPLTHDIMISSLKEFGIKIEYVVIKRMPSGVFAADLHLSDNLNTKIIDVRSSDAVALAIRTNAPIYTTEDVIREASFEFTKRKGMKQPPKDSGQKTDDVRVKPTSYLENMTLEQLYEAMERASIQENYEEAARIKEEIEKRNIS